MLVKWFAFCLLFCVLEIGCKPGKKFRNDYQYINETRSFYKLHYDTPSYSWLYAKAACEMEGASLFFAENEREAIVVTDFYGGSWSAEKIYVGIYKHSALESQLVATEDFSTMDGRPLADVHHTWEPGQPNNGEGIEHCGCMKKTGYLHDYPCLRPLNDVHFICKKSATNWSHRVCKPGKFYVNDYIYLNETNSFYKFHDEKTPYSWLYAKTACELEGATLFFPENEREAKAVIDYFTTAWKLEKIFIGIYKHNAIQKQIDANEPFKTMDGRVLDVVHHRWEPGQPNNWNGIEHCLCMKKDKNLHDYPCLDPYDDVQFICKKTEAENEKPEKFFRKDYKYIEETESFYKIHTINRNWQDAKTSCELEGATLFYPQDEDEAHAVISYWNTTQSSFWIHVGISAPNVKNVYETVDGLRIEDVYDNWAPAEPSGGSEACVVLRRDGVLTDDECSLTWPFICKKTEVTLRWNDRCGVPDPEYKYNEKTGRCYKLHLTPKNWKDSYITCSMEQSRLAIINSDEEAEILVDMISNSSKDFISAEYIPDAVILGFKYENGWKTYQGTDLYSSGYVKWGQGLPQGRGNNTCGAMFYNGLLNVVSCDAKTFFVCVKSPHVRSDDTNTI